MRAMQRYHLETKGWLDVAYNHATCRHGFVFVGRGFGIRSAANGTKDANDRYFAVCFLGDDSAGRADVTSEARRALRQLIAEYRRRYPAARQVRPHSDFVATECPGDELRTLISRL
jgi:N-acetylmuramoyl-L-alanine amidase